jgi:hypothetical protein
VQWQNGPQIGANLNWESRTMTLTLPVELCAVIELSYRTVDNCCDCDRVSPKRWHL